MTPKIDILYYKCRRCGAESKHEVEQWSSMPSWDCGCGGTLMIIKELRAGKKRATRNQYLKEDLPDVPKKPYCFEEKDFDDIYNMVRYYKSASIPFEMRQDKLTIYSIRHMLEEKLFRKVAVDEQKSEWVIGDYEDPLEGTGVIE